MSGKKGSRKSWRCFFCDEVFRTRRAAWLHFGEENCESDVPACVDPLRQDEQKRLDEVRLAREHALKTMRENEHLAEKVENLEYRLDCNDSELRRWFGKDVTSLWQAGDRYKNVLFELEQLRPKIAAEVGAMTQKPELGTCDTTKLVDSTAGALMHTKPHQQLQTCRGWQALPPSQEGTPMGKMGNSDHVVDSTKQIGESGAGTRRALAIEMGNAGYCNYDACEKYLKMAWNAARKECAEIARKHNERHVHTATFNNCGREIAAAIERLEDE